MSDASHKTSKHDSLKDFQKVKMRSQVQQPYRANTPNLFFRMRRPISLHFANAKNGTLFLSKNTRHRGNKFSLKRILWSAQRAGNLITGNLIVSGVPLA